METVGRLGEQVAQLQQQRHLRPCCSSSALILEASVALTRRASDTACVPSAKSFSRMIMSLVPCVKRWQDRDMLMAVSSLSPVRTHTCAMRCLCENRPMTTNRNSICHVLLGKLSTYQLHPSPIIQGTRGPHPQEKAMHQDAASIGHVHFCK